MAFFGATGLSDVWENVGAQCESWLISHNDNSKRDESKLWFLHGLSPYGHWDLSFNGWILTLNVRPCGQEFIWLISSPTNTMGFKLSVTMRRFTTVMQNEYVDGNSDCLSVGWLLGTIQACWPHHALRCLHVLRDATRCPTFLIATSLETLGLWPAWHKKAWPFVSFS